MKTNADEYIVIRCPNNNLGKPITVIHVVITRRQLGLLIDKCLEGKIKVDKDLPVPVALFNYIAKRRRNYTFIDAVRRAKYLNKQKKYGNNN